MKNKLFILVFFVIGSLLNAKTAELPDLMKPEQIAVDKESLFIVDNQSYSILVYSLTDFKLTGKFGKKGEGPGEFAMIPQLFLKEKEILVFAGRKYYRFSKKGTLLEEKKLEPFLGINRLAPLEANYVIQHFTYYPESTAEIYLGSNRFEKLKSLYKKKIPKADTKKPMSLVNPKVNIRAYAGRIYIANAEKGLYIEVYNSKGEKIETIKKDYKKVPVTAAHRKKIKEDFMASRGARRFRAYFKNRKFSFPDFFPAVDDFFVSREKIYIKTHNLKGGKHEYLILNLKGDLINSVFLPEAAYKLYVIENGFYYYLSENEDLTEWEVHSIKIDH